jgi:ArsR family transcriptional regulator
MAVLEPTLGVRESLKLLADPTRQRILALLEREELSVGELSRALEASQSRVSNHLRVLREAGLLAERHAGTSTFLRLAAQQNGRAALGRLWDALRQELVDLPEHAADRVRLERVVNERRLREGDFFDRVAGTWDKRAGDFETGLAVQRAAVQLLPRDYVVADLGCGTGAMAAALLGACSRVICVDRSGGMLAEAEKGLRGAAAGTRLEFRQGELDALPITDGEVDAVVCGMVLHHLPDLDDAVAEMRRVLKPGGSAVILELAPHRETWMRAALGDRHLGLDSGDVLAALERAGFEELVLDPVADRYCPRRPEDLDQGSPCGTSEPLPLYVVRGRSPQIPLPPQS